jgi:hypothetical protein
VPVTGRSSNGRRIGGAFGKDPVRVAAAKRMLGGPVSLALLSGIRKDNGRLVSNNDLAKAVIAPWFTYGDGHYRLTMKGRDEYIEMMDGSQDEDTKEPPAVLTAAEKRKIRSESKKRADRRSRENEARNDAERIEMKIHSTPAWFSG